MEKRRDIFSDLEFYSYTGAETFGFGMRCSDAAMERLANNCKQ
jgi:hypothetical protein